jgi:hypothetical protein
MVMDIDPIKEVAFDEKSKPWAIVHFIDDRLGKYFYKLYY